MMRMEPRDGAVGPGAADAQDYKAAADPGHAATRTEPTFRALAAPARSRLAGMSCPAPLWAREHCFIRSLMVLPQAADMFRQS